MAAKKAADGRAASRMGSDSARPVARKDAQGAAAESITFRKKPPPDAGDSKGSPDPGRVKTLNLIVRAPLQPM